jgi:hypothetical protein
VRRAFDLGLVEHASMLAHAHDTRALTRTRFDCHMIRFCMCMSRTHVCAALACAHKISSRNVLMACCSGWPVTFDETIPFEEVTCMMLIT